MDILTTIKQHLNTDFFDLTVVEEIDSTNRVVKEWGKSGRPAGSVLIARSQTAGRGRLGRSFYSPKSGIYFSILLRPHLSLKDTLRLTTAAAVSVAETLGEQAKIKWVNDIYLHGKKVCGILTESAFSGEKTDYAVVGIGLNLTVPDEGFPAELSDIAGAIFDTAPTENQVACLVADILQRFYEHSQNLFDSGIHRAYASRNLLQGKSVTAGDISGVATGISPDFGLLVQDETGITHTITAGEATIGSRNCKE